jgi:thymidylate synthase
MNHEEQAYLDLMRNILENGNERSDRTGVGTKSLFGSMLRFNLSDGTLPVLTTKKTFYRGAIEEMLFFIRGETDTKKLEAKGVNIWKGNTSREFLDKQGLFHLSEGNLGALYGKQWRKWEEPEWGYPTGVGAIIEHDQLQVAFNRIKSDPYSRRHIVSAWNVSDLHAAPLFPCHYAFQFYVENGTLSCMFQMRSSDIFLGAPFNIIGYAFLTHVMAAATGLTAKEVIFCGGDTHVYKSHFEQVKEQLTREPYPFPKMTIKKSLASLQDIEALTFEDLEITGYRHHEAIKAEIAI